MVCVSNDFTFVKSPRVDVAVVPRPTTVPTPIDSCGLKYTISSGADSKKSVFKSMSYVLGIKLTFVDTVWTPAETPLLTLKILCSLNVFKTTNYSVPIPILLPTEVKLGIFWM